MRRLSLGFLLLLLLAACLDHQPPPGAPRETALTPDPAPESSAMKSDPNVNALLQSLTQAGYGPLGSVPSDLPILDPAPGIAYRFESGVLHVHRFNSAAAASARAVAIRELVEPPPFVQCGPLVAVYNGDDAAFIAALQAACATIE